MKIAMHNGSNNLFLKCMAITIKNIFLSVIIHISSLNFTVKACKHSTAAAVVLDYSPMCIHPPFIFSSLLLFSLLYFHQVLLYFSTQSQQFFHVNRQTKRKFSIFIISHQTLLWFCREKNSIYLVSLISPTPSLYSTKNLVKYVVLIPKSFPSWLEALQQDWQLFGLLYIFFPQAEQANKQKKNFLLLISPSG